MDERSETVSQRSKEFANDYRYFPEPDLPPMVIDRKWVEEIRAKLPELPDARKERFKREHGLPNYDAMLLTASKALADYYEACASIIRARDVGNLQAQFKQISNWLLGDFSRLLNASNMEISKSKIRPPQLVEIIGLLERGTINGPSAKLVFEEMFASGRNADAIVAEKGLAQVSDADAIEAIVEKVVQANPKAVVDYKAGKEQASKFLIGQVLKESKGRANPTMVQEQLLKKLDGK